ncbi:MAG: acylphosphatase [Lentimicrobium sp.]|jgi:acylphosphatase|nr:acylphosphatase [Lentimicrobium sp.]
MKKYRYRLLIAGNVLRIGFRHQVLIFANLTGVAGFAGYVGSTVFIEAEGLPEQLAPFVEWCKKGPEGCVISKFEILEIPPLNSESFVIYPNLIPVLQTE